jgi:hypothetical protein
MVKSKSKLGQVPLEIYAEYAAYLAPESMNFYVRKRREVSAAIFIQYHFRRWKKRRSEDELNRLLMFRMLVRWTKRVFYFRTAARLCAACRTLIAQNLILFLKDENDFVETGETGTAVQLPIMSLTNLFSVSEQGTVEDASAARPYTSSPVNFSKPVRRRQVVFSPVSDDSSLDEESIEEPSLAPTEILEDEQVDPDPATQTVAQHKILERLVLVLQSLFRGKRDRKKFEKLKKEKELKRSLEAKMEALRTAVFAAAAQRARKTGNSRIGRPTTPEDEPVLVASTLVRQPTRSRTRERDLNDEAISFPSVSILVTESGQRIEYPEGGLEALNFLKTKFISFNCQAALVWLKANALVLEAARAVDPHATADMTEGERKVVKVDPFNIILPQDIEGLLSHGMIVDSESPLHGAMLGGQGWEVAELNEEEEYELRPEHINRAATRIQRIFRRYLTRRKFVAYLQEKDLEQLREEERVDVAEDEQGEVVPAAPQDTVNTDACVIS